MKQLVIVVLSLFIIGCASVGTKLDQNKVQLIKEGITTKNEVIELLGNPYMITLSSDKKEILMYQYANAKTRPSTFVPVVGLFNGGVDMDQQMLQVLIDEKGIVEKYTFSMSKTPVNTGLSNQK